jgi:Zn finger protein HypA/HybF involved in hydrogenase expression
LTPHTRYKLEEILVENSNYYGMIRLKSRLIREKEWKYECSVCKLSEWMGTKIPIQVDHINGDHFDNRIENLRFICPNCHAQTDNYAGKNIKRDTIAKHKVPKFCECGQKIHYQSSNCNTCAKQVRKLNIMREKPSYEQLLEDLKTMSYVAVGQKYNVSDNAIRKWMKFYEEQPE